MSKILTIYLFFICCLSLSSQDSLKTVIAEKGDGIYSLLRKNGINPTKFYNAFIKVNKELLTEEEYLKIGQSYFIPDTIQYNRVEKVNLKTTINYPIFGEDFSGVDSLSNRLKDVVYYLVSGHGGPDPGAVVSYDGEFIAEDEYAYDITLRLARELISHGAQVFIIIKDENDGIRDRRKLELDIDEVTYSDKQIPLNQLARLKQRVKEINDLYKQNLGKYQRLIVTHVDSRSKGTNIDVFFYHHKKSKNGKRLAESIHKTFLKKYAKFQPNRGYQGTFEDRSGLYMVKKTLPSMAYIEVGNIQNKKDQRRILDPDNRQALAKWISEGVILDFESRNMSN